MRREAKAALRYNDGHFPSSGRLPPREMTTPHLAVQINDYDFYFNNQFV